MPYGIFGLFTKLPREQGHMRDLSDVIGEFGTHLKYSTAAVVAQYIANSTSEKPSKY